MPGHSSCITLICTKIPRCVEEFMVNSIKLLRTINKLNSFPKVSHTSVKEAFI